MPFLSLRPRRSLEVTPPPPPNPAPPQPPPPRGGRTQMERLFIDDSGFFGLGAPANLAALDGCDGIRIKDRRIKVDVERGRTVKGWKPRRMGGGLGGRGYTKAMPARPMGPGGFGGGFRGGF